MSNSIVRPEIDSHYEGSEDLSRLGSASMLSIDSVVVPLFPPSFIKDSKYFNDTVNTTYTELHLREERRRQSFLDACVFIDYPEEIEVIDADLIAAENSDTAWNRKYSFPDGSYLKGSDLRVVDENADYTDVDKEDISISGREIILNDHRIKYQLEADRFREELEELAELDSTFTPNDTTIVEVLDNDIDPVISDELDELFRQSDEREAILAVERERIAKEEKKAQLAEIFKFLSEGLEED